MQVSFQELKPPVISWRIPKDDSVFATGQPVQFKLSTLQGADVTWDFGDGQTATGQDVRHVYNTAGKRSVTVTVTDPELGPTVQKFDIETIEVVMDIKPVHEVIVEGLRQRFVASGRGGVESCQWLIDGNLFDGGRLAPPENQSEITYTFQSPGPHEVTVLGLARGARPQSKRNFTVEPRPRVVVADGPTRPFRDCLPAQVIASCGRLSVLGQNVLGKRLFTVKQLDCQRNVLVLKSPPGATAWRVRLETADVPATLEKTTAWCLQRGLDVVLYLRGIDEDQRRRQDAALAAKGSGRIAVLADLDRALAVVPPLDVDAIFYQEAMHEDLCLALRRHAGHDQTVIFSIAARGTQIAASQAGIVPVVAERSTPPLVTAHLRSMARLLRARVPIDAETWGRFGLECAALPRLDRDVEAIGPSLRIDACEEAEYRSEVWPYLSLDRPWDECHPVRVFGLPGPDRAVYRTVDGSGVVAGRLRAETDQAGAPGPPQGRFARWFEDDTALGDVGEVDLAHQHEFRLVCGRRSIGLRTSGGRTASRILRSLLSVPEELLGLFHLAQWALEQLQGPGLPIARRLRRLARVGYRGDDRSESPDEAQALLKLVRDRIQASRGTASK